MQLCVVDKRPAITKTPWGIYAMFWLLWLLWAGAFVCLIFFVLATPNGYSRQRKRLLMKRKVDPGGYVGAVYNSVTDGPAMGLLVCVLLLV
jgi:hypothetical protein